MVEGDEPGGCPLRLEDEEERRPWPGGHGVWVREQRAALVGARVPHRQVTGEDLARERHAERNLVGGDVAGGECPPREESGEVERRPACDEEGEGQGDTTGHDGILPAAVAGTCLA